MNLSEEYQRQAVKDLWELGITRGSQDERERIIKLLKEHKWFEKGEQDTILGILDGTYECHCGCLELTKGKKNEI